MLPGSSSPAVPATNNPVLAAIQSAVDIIGSSADTYSDFQERQANIAAIKNQDVAPALSVRNIGTPPTETVQNYRNIMIWGGIGLATVAAIALIAWKR